MEEMLPREKTRDKVYTQTMISSTLHAVTFTPHTCRTLNAKYLMACKYIHRIKKYDISWQEVKNLREAVLEIGHMGEALNRYKDFDTDKKTA